MEDFLDKFMPTIKGSLDYGFKGKVWFGGEFQGETDKNNTFIILKKNNISVIWNLLEHPTYLKEEQEHFTSYHTPIHDYDIPTDKEKFMEVLGEILRTLEFGHNIYIHCFGGTGRTGMVLLALAAITGKNIDNWETKIYKATGGGPETEEQIKFARECL
jgi:protein-tyrosine phosphatase